MKPTFMKLWGKLPTSISLAACNTVSQLSEREMLMLPLQSNLPIFKSELPLLLPWPPAAIMKHFHLSQWYFSKEQLKKEAILYCQPCMKTQKGNCPPLNLVVKPIHSKECTWYSEMDTHAVCYPLAKGIFRTISHRCIKTLLLDEKNGLLCWCRRPLWVIHKWVFESPDGMGSGCLRI